MGIKVATVALTVLVLHVGPVPASSAERAPSGASARSDCGSAAGDDWFLWDMPECLTGARGKGCTTAKEFRKVKEGWTRKRVMRKLSTRRVLVADALEGDEYSARVTHYSTRPCDREAIAQFLFDFRALPDGAGGYGAERLTAKRFLWAW